MLKKSVIFALAKSCEVANCVLRRKGTGIYLLFFNYFLDGKGPDFSE
jgi:hypothetical protein